MPAHWPADWEYVWRAVCAASVRLLRSECAAAAPPCAAADPVKPQAWLWSPHICAALDLQTVYFLCCQTPYPKLPLLSFLLSSVK